MIGPLVLVHSPGVSLFEGTRLCGYLANDQIIIAQARTYP